MTSNAGVPLEDSREPERRVLLVDDEPLLLTALQRIVERAIAPSTVLVAKSGDEAIEAMHGSEVDLVVTDLSMPSREDGFRLLERLQDQQFRGQTAVMSGRITPEIELRLRDLGVVICFQKPIQPSRFVTLCRRALEGYDNNLSDLSPIGVAQMLELEGKSCLLRMHFGDRRGDLVFSSGKLVDAWTSEANGERAAETILRWPTAEMRLFYMPPGDEPRIQRSLGQIILEAAHREDEARREGKDPLAPAEQEEPTGWDTPSESELEPDSLPLFCVEQLDTAFKDLLALEGAKHLALVDTHLDRAARVASANPEADADGESDVRFNLLRGVAQATPVEDLLITLRDEYHLIRPLLRYDRFMLYLILDRQRANPALARFMLEKHCSLAKPVML
ncbi:MAG: response regulator [Acidobacteriota bacterium]